MDKKERLEILLTKLNAAFGDEFMAVYKGISDAIEKHDLREKLGFEVYIKFQGGIMDAILQYVDAEVREENAALIEEINKLALEL